MKKTSSILLLIVVIVSLLSCNNNVKPAEQTSSNKDEKPKYNKALADSLGADDYGMKMYTLVILKTGENTIEDKAKRDSIFGGHLKNIGHLAEIGKLVIAGPLKENDKHYEGIFVLNVKTVEEAKLLLDTDPAIHAKLLDTELYPWYGSAALPLYLKSHDIIQKTSF